MNFYLRNSACNLLKKKKHWYWVDDVPCKHLFFLLLLIFIKHKVELKDF
jgi:hypothetical protein